MPGRLRARRLEIEQAIRDRIYSVSDPADTGDPEYQDRLRETVSTALDFGLAAIEGEARAGLIPAELLSQARRAARAGVALDTVFRRYLAGYVLLGDFLMHEAEAGTLEFRELRHMVRAQATLFDRLIEAVVAEYKRGEAEHGSYSSQRRRAECVAGLLRGELVDTGELAYDIDAWHIGLIAVGNEAEQAMRELASTIDRRLLLVDRGEGVLWAWFGGQREVSSARIAKLAQPLLPRGVTLAIGEPGEGQGGWRLTHQQARAALPIARRGSRALTRYADVSLVASILQDGVLLASLRQLYLAPLSGGRDGGATLRRTLRAYFAAGRNAAPAAAALGVTRQTVNNRLRVIEERLDRPLGSCAAELEAALRLEELEEHPTGDVSISQS